MLDLPKAIKSIGENDAKINVISLNNTAFMIRQELANEIKGIYRNPSPFTISSFYVKKATPTNHQAVISTKEISKGTNPANIHTPNIKGEQRKKKGFEIRLDNEGVMAPKNFFVPTKDFPKNKFGQPNRKAINKILSQFDTLSADGFSGNKTDSKRSKGKRQREVYFLNLADDKVIIYQRKDREIKPYLVGVESADEYKQIFDYEDIVQESFDYLFPKVYQETFEKYSGVSKHLK